MAKKFRLKCNEEYEKAYPDSWGAEIKAKLMKGKELSVRRNQAKGGLEAQLSSKEKNEKIEKFFSYGGVSDVKS